MPASLVKKIDYKSELHKQLLEAINNRYRFSRDRMSNFYDVWRKDEDSSLAFMPVTANDALRKTQRDTAGVPQYTTIVVPYSYALLQAAHTYWTSVFLGRTPVFQYTGRHGEGEMQVQAIETLIDYQAQVGRWLAPLYIWLHDAGLYGLGVMFSYWEEEKETVSRIVEVPKQIMGIDIPGTTRKVRQTMTIPGYEGQKLFNVRPFDFFPDPRVPAWDIQRGEFVGRVYDEGWMELKKGEQEGKYFNIDEVWRQAQGNMARETGSSQMTMPFDSLIAAGYLLDDKDKGFNEIFEFYWNLVPKDCNLGSSEKPEKWVFLVANKTVIISAQPMGYYHNRWPVYTLPYEVDGYQVLARGLLEVARPLNDTLTWLVNAHFFNVRKILNDQFIVDPSAIEMTDVLDPGPGRIWRLKPAAYGMDISKMYAQMTSVDVTQQNLKDGQVVGEMMQRVIGASDAIMGQQHPGGRKTATEFRGASGMSANRLKTNTEWMSATGFSSLGQIAVQTTQQMYTEPKKFRIAGDTMQQSREVKPEEIQGFFDFVPVDGSLPIDKFALATLWKEIIKELMSMPQLAMKYDIGKIFEYAAQLGGLKAIKQFRIQVQSPEEIAAQAQAGNLIPITGGKGATSRPSPTSSSASVSDGGLPDAPRLTGVGPTG